MAEYHVGCGFFGIYAGTLKKPDEWKDKTDVTNEAIDAVLQYLYQEDKEVRFSVKGKNYVMRIEEMKEGEA